MNTIALKAAVAEFSGIIQTYEMDKRNCFLIKLFDTIDLFRTHQGSIRKNDLDIIKQCLTKIVKETPDVIKGYKKTQELIEKIYRSHYPTLPEDIVAKIRDNRATLDHLDGEWKKSHKNEDDILREISEMNESNAPTILQKLVIEKTEIFRLTHVTAMEHFHLRAGIIFSEIEKDINDISLGKFTSRTLSHLNQFANRNYALHLTLFFLKQIVFIRIIHFFKFPQTLHNLITYTAFVYFLSLYRARRNVDAFPLPVTIPFQVAAVLMTIAYLKQAE
ncbi:MAG: hypothetical protein RLZZ453_75 [Chlamydiota bacterium]|jgi:hypothetical protein